MARTKFVAGNWKMNGTRASLAELQAIGAGLASSTCDVAICPPFTLIGEAVGLADGTRMSIGGQDCHAKASGAHTGDISAEMLKDIGASLVIVGHSERRTDHRESDADVRSKAEAAWRAGLLAVVCIGETEAERRSGETNAVLSRQIEGSVPEGASAENLVVAYEPVWAIGTGLTPSLDDILDAHTHIRSELTRLLGEVATRVRVLYGGSVKPSNAAEIMALDGVDGALVGGASLKAVDFLGIVSSCG